MLVARRVQKVAETQDKEHRLEELPLDNFRMTPAWVLLGEPGAGKSEALKQAALEVEGVYVTVNELINTTPPLEEWREKTLFIDALDEARSAGADSLPLRIRQQLLRELELNWWAEADRRPAHQSRHHASKADERVPSTVTFDLEKRHGRSHLGRYGLSAPSHTLT